MWYAVRRLKREQAARLSVAALAARGDPKEVTRIIKEADKP